MATEILDAFLISVGIDARAYQSGEREVRASFKKTREESKATFDGIEDRAKKGGQSIRSLANDVAGLVLVFAGAKSVIGFASNLISTTANASRLGETLGMTAGRVVGWEKAIESVGGAAGEADGALQAMQNTIMQWKLTPTSVNPGLLAMGIGPQDMTSGPEHLLMKIAEARKSFTAPEYASRLGMLGLPQGMIYLLEQGPKGVKKLVDEMERHAKITKRDEDAAKSFQKAMVDLSTTIEGQVRPALTKGVEMLDRLLGKADAISTAMPIAAGAVAALGISVLKAAGPWGRLAFMIGVVVSALDDLIKKNPKVRETLDNLEAPLRKFLPGWLFDRGDGVPPPDEGGGSNPAPKARGGSAPTAPPDDWAPFGLGWAGKGPTATAPSLRDQAEAAITGIGGRITSRTRSYAEQKVLFDRYEAYRQGRGPWAPLAARPGTSAHETGRALDIGNGPGISIASIAAALFSRHIPFNDLRNEGNHFHVALGARAALAGARRGSGGGSHTTTVGPITIHTTANDGHGIARDLRSALRNRSLTNQADRGLDP